MIIMMKNKIKISFALVIFAAFMLLTSCQSNVLLDFINQLELPTETMQNIELKSEYEYKNKKIAVSWYSSNEAVISTTGVVNYKKTDVTVTIIANASLDGKVEKKVFMINVKGQNDEEIVKKAANSIVFPVTIQKDIQLPNTKNVDGKEVSITWKSSDEEILSNTGKVKLPLVDTKIDLKGTFTFNKTSYEQSYQVTVLKDPMYNPENAWHLLPLYTGDILNEAYPEVQKEFPGAIYRKVMSSRDYWQGIEVTVTLPEFTGDEKRTGVNPLGRPTDMRYLDNGSVYLGGNASRESDCGLTWSIGAKDATVTEVDYSKSIAYRPFWRYITVSGQNIYANAKWQDTQFYYYPGDKVRMSVYTPESGYLQLRIELLEETTIEKYAKIRESYHLGDNYEKVFVSSLFESNGMGTYKASFKRVVAIDQVNNEAKPTCPTNASNIGAIYHECYLYRTINGKMYKVPFIERRYNAINSPSGKNALGDFAGAITVTYDGVDKNLGGEVVSIDPKNNV